MLLTYLYLQQYDYNPELIILLIRLFILSFTHSFITIYL